ncbi:glycerophosphodiester phosphodiesterase family protein [Sphingobacterium spiritivorum]|uniref:glycerophosphodiester phosphodiesterase family protein n=1 Tax=Sphingobacterium spiritivorum TaxID=258 RepID=UPI003DA24066
MNKRILIFLLGFILFTTVSSCIEMASSNKPSLTQGTVFKFKSVDDLYQFLTYDEKRYPLVSAHRGGPYPGYPENAIETFDYIASKQPSIIECDVRLTKDSALVLMHDDKLDRTTNGTGKVSDYTLAELKKLKLKDNNGKLTLYRIPTLEEALAWGIGKVIYTLDVKQETPYSLVINAIRKTRAEAHVIIITYNPNQADRIFSLAPDLMISASIRNSGDLLRLNDRDIPDNRLVAFVGTREADKGLVDLLHGHGIPIILGTMGNLDKQAKANGNQIYAEYVDRGADILSTDRPLEAGKSLKYYILKRGIKSPFIN